MRIIAGSAGRIAIKVPKGVTRPTTDFVRQAMFSILGARVEEAAALDLFAGSGAIGLEALSRGAKSCVFVEEHRAAEKVLHENLAKARLAGGRVVRAEVHGWLGRDRGGYDLIFADPPYVKSPLVRDHLGVLLGGGKLVERLAEGGLLVVEQSAAEPERGGAGLELIDRRVYGSSSILLYARAGDS